MRKLLHFEVLGELNSERVVVIVHGLFGSKKNWRSIARSLSDLGFRVVVVDMRNHGLSFWDESHSYEDMANDLRDVIVEFGRDAYVIGHSMGGKAAMALALLYGDCVTKLVVIDIAPVRYDHYLEHLSYISALESVDLNSVDTRKKLVAKLSESIADPTLQAFFSQSANLSHHKNRHWLFNLRSLKKNLKVIMDFPQLPMRSPCPTLVIRGALSDYVSDKHLVAIKAYFPNSKLVTIKQSGHWVHAEKREEFETHLGKFLIG